MKKTVRLLALLLSALLLFCSCELPFLSDGESAAESEETADGLTQSTEDSSESSAPATTDAPDTPKEPAVKVKTIKIYNAGQLMSLLELSRAEDYATTSKNTVYQLQCDIDLNEGWNGSMGDNGAVPELPSNVWTGIEKFYGTLDGNGHAIRGIYMYANIESAASMGFIGELCGGTIKNLTIENSFISANVAMGTEGVAVGALVGSVNESSVMENVTVNATVYVSGDELVSAGVAVGKKADGALTETGIVENGQVQRVEGDTSVIRVATAEQLLAAIAVHGDFKDKTLRLTADIDLNPGWNADVTIGDTVVFPETPANVWTPISVFRGVLDGNGHILSGLYVNNAVAGGGAYGGLFHTLDGGTVQNLAIVNSFILASNPGWGAKSIHVGGIAGDVNANSVLNTVYMDAEVWYQSNEQCMLGGAFGFANGQYTVKGYVFVGRVGNTSNALAPNYATPTYKDIYIGQITGCQNHYSDATITNSLVAGVKYSGRDSSTSQHLGVDFPWSLKFVLVGSQTSEWLNSRQDYRDAGFVYHEGLGSAIPGEALDLVNAVHAQQ